MLKLAKYLQECNVRDVPTHLESMLRSSPASINGYEGSITFEWKMFRIPAHASLYSLVCGLIEMLVLGVLYGLTLTVH
jgi:hypothetical protein